ncbi:DDE-type integrase/transposase/recombinase, partial [Pseudoalteromonas sp. MMG012]|uniref:DDE-type integrase/transposase/recombinase n=1 Tax=Pseudoalteromonas sp. MMG012 TaxID=2822686 RepID=UPI001B3A095A
HGQKGTIREEACKTLGLSKDALYRRLKSLGWESGKAKRSDAGTTAMDNEAINMLVSILNQGVRDNGKRIMDVTTAKSILVANGYQCLSTSQISRVLAKRNASVTALDKPAPHIQMRSLAPNHVHQVDPSYCLLYYPPGKKGKVQRYANDSEFYANKPENLERIKHLRVWRYVLIDHNSGMVRVRYYESAGETQANMFDFLMWCWKWHDGSAFMGVPQIMLWDKGSANTGKAITNVLDALKVKNIPHEAGNPRAKGAVEVANNIVEKQFESRILFEPVSSVEELNESVWAWQEAFNANKVPGMNCKHTRHKQARLDVWLTIYQPQNRDYLRMLPDEQICRLLLTKTGDTRTVKDGLTITYVHPLTKTSLSYDLYGLEHVRNGIKVSVSPILIGDTPDLLVGVKTPLDEVVYHQVAPANFDASGFRVDAAIIGEEHQRHADTATQTAAKEADRLAYGNLSDDEIKKAKKQKTAPFNGKLVAHSHLKNVEHETRIAPKGETITPDSPVAKQIAQAPKRKGKVLDNLDLRMLVAERLGRGLRPTEVEWLAHQAVVETEVSSIVEQLHNGIAETPVYKLAR